MSARFRSGSSFPATGYWESRGTFTWSQKRLTLFVEALNVYGRRNARFASPGVNLRTGQAFGLFDELFPFVPSAGVLLEF
jgi:uncharacterized protein (DUF2062 family)